MGTQTYGPQTEAVEALIERHKNTTALQAHLLQDAWKRTDGHWLAVFRATTAKGDTQRQRWCAIANRAVRNVSWIAEIETAIDTTMSAVIALVFRDLISEDDFDTLYGPWASVMEVAS